MEIWERIRYFRKNVLKMTQADFAEKLKISRSNLGNIETGRITVTDRLTSDLCNAFSLSEKWLRTGEGEMRQDTETTLFANFAHQYDLSEAEQSAARYLLSLSSEERESLLHHLLGLADAIRWKSPVPDASCGGTGGKSGGSERSGRKATETAAFPQLNEAARADARHLTDEQRAAIDKEISDYKQELEAEATSSKSEASTTSSAKRA